MRLDEYAFDAVPDRSAVGQLPEDVQAQLIAAKQNGTHTVPQMIEWLHDESVHGADYSYVTASILHGWFHRKGCRGPTR